MLVKGATDGTKPLPEPLLAYNQYGSAPFTEMQ